MTQALGYLRAELHQLGRGPFRGELHLVQLGNVNLLQVSVNRAVHGQGCKPGTYGFDVITAANQAIKLQRRPVQAGQIHVIGPPGEWDHVTTAPEYQHLSVTVDAEVLQQVAAILSGMDLNDWLESGRPFRPSPATFAAIEAHLRQLFAQVGSQPTLLDRPQYCQRMGRTCIEMLLQAVFAGESAEEEPRRMANHREVARRAEDFMIAHLDQNLSVADLCEELGVSERTLRYAFQDLFGLSPMAYFKSRKLNAVRHELKAADPGTATLHEIARRWGFGHTGNFAADYRRLFGELPSETLGG
jgi:AraC family ethanolamine operon transcriptional activator